MFRSPATASLSFSLLIVLLMAVGACRVQSDTELQDQERQEQSTANAIEDTSEVVPGAREAPLEASIAGARPQIVRGKQAMDVTVTPSGIRPKRILLMPGVETVLTFQRTADSECATITIPAFEIRQSIPPEGESAVMFTPQEQGDFEMSCASGAPAGEIVVQT